MKYNELKNIEKSAIMKSNYRYWKFNALEDAGYFTIFQGFLEGDKLKNISGNALKLYIYLGINSSNLDGIVWHSNEKISKYFNKSERTIRAWMKELEDMNLIKRLRLKYDGNVFTHLQPYKYKLNLKSESSKLEHLQGYIYIDEIGGIHIKGENIIIPVLRSMYVEIFDDINEEWIEGKIEIRRFDFDLDMYDFEDKDIMYDLNQIRYIFKSSDGLLKININKNKKLKVRVSFV